MAMMPAFGAELPKMKGGAVPLMNVAIDGHGPADSTTLLHDPNGNGDVVDHAEALAVIGKGVVKATADVDAYTVLQRPLRSQDGPSGVQHEGVDHLWRVGNFHLQLFARAQAAFHQLVDVMRGVDQGNVAIRSLVRER